MKKSTIVTAIASLLMCSLPLFLNAQKGSVKIFSELKSVNIYLDEVLKGIDLIKLDSISTGSHYLKVVKDDVIVFGELITVKENEALTILIKDSKDIQDKLLARKYKEQELYRSKKLDVLQDTKLVTETTGNTEITEKTKSLYFPGYFSVLGGSNTTGKANTNSTTTTRSETSWFIIKGNQRIDHDEFALLTNYEAYSNSQKEYQNKLSYYNAHLKDRPKWKVDWSTTLIGLAFSSAGVLLYDRKVNMFAEDAPVGKVMLNALCGSSALVGSIALISGFFHHQSTPNPRPYFYSPISMDDAIREAKEYNRKLKIELGLPETFELQK